MKKGGAYQSVPRVDYNCFVDDKGMDPGPYDLRVTGVNGGAVEDTGVPLVPNRDAPGAAQLPACK